MILMNDHCELNLRPSLLPRRTIWYGWEGRPASLSFSYRAASSIILPLSLFFKTSELSAIELYSCTALLDSWTASAEILDAFVAAKFSPPSWSSVTLTIRNISRNLNKTRSSGWSATSSTKTRRRFNRAPRTSSVGGWSTQASRVDYSCAWYAQASRI